jgi:hypothetical protein
MPLYAVFRHFFQRYAVKRHFFSAESINFGYSALQGHWATFSSSETLTLKSANLSPFFQR